MSKPMPRGILETKPPTKHQRARMAEPLVIDFSDVPLPHWEEVPNTRGKGTHRRGNGRVGPEKRRKLVMTPRQIRARARRTNRMSKEEFEILYKPVEDWDEEELARGRPRNSAGDFRGPAPQWLTREVYEKALERFKQIVRMEVNAMGPVAMGVIRRIMTDEATDSRGKWRTPASARLQAAQLMMEHIIGKPIQEMHSEVSVKLQAILADATVGPGSLASDKELQQIAQDKYEKAYGELMSGALMRPSTEDPQRIVDAEVIEDD